jgi:hypothetical protein
MTTDTIRNRLSLFVAFAATVGGFLIAVPIALVAGPAIEARVFPVLRGAHVISAQRDGHAVVFDVAGTKARGCTYRGASALAGPRAGYMEQASITFPASVGDASAASRPLGEQSFGPWRIEPVASGEVVAIQLRHHCHGLWDTVTQLGPWRVAGMPASIGGEP